METSECRLPHYRTAVFRYAQTTRRHVSIPRLGNIFGNRLTCLKPSHWEPLWVFSSYLSSYATPGTNSLMEWMNFSRPKPGCSGTLRGRLWRDVSIAYKTPRATRVGGRSLEGNDISRLDLCRSGLYAFRCQEVQSSDLVQSVRHPEKSS
jgi:hypothetical protein